MNTSLFLWMFVFVLSESFGLEGLPPQEEEPIVNTTNNQHQMGMYQRRDQEWWREERRRQRREEFGKTEHDRLITNENKSAALKNNYT